MRLKVVSYLNRASVVPQTFPSVKYKLHSGVCKKYWELLNEDIKFKVEFESDFSKVFALVSGKCGSVLLTDSIINIAPYSNCSRLS